MRVPQVPDALHEAYFTALLMSITNVLGFLGLAAIITPLSVHIQLIRQAHRF
ncbi:MAG: hypothetical protein ABJA49_04400 [Betaproteobacteria bacterium]